jgi:MinD superfamily P-loop ATPase
LSGFTKLKPLHNGYTVCALTPVRSQQNRQWILSSGCQDCNVCVFVCGP